jgi:hypothetical protein
MRPEFFWFRSQQTRNMVCDRKGGLASVDDISHSGRGDMKFSRNVGLRLSCATQAVADI